MSSKGSKKDGDQVVIGAMTTHAEVASSAALRDSIAALAQLASGIGDAQVRNRGTLGGSIANNDPAADYPAALIGLGATVHTDRRTLSADDFFTGMFETALEADELVTRVAFPIPSAPPIRNFPTRLPLRHRWRHGRGNRRRHQSGSDWRRWLRLPGCRNGSRAG